MSVAILAQVAAKPSPVLCPACARVIVARQCQARLPAGAMAVLLLAACASLGRLVAGGGVVRPVADRPMSDPPKVAPAWSVDFQGPHIAGLKRNFGTLWYDEAGARHRWAILRDPGFLEPGQPPVSADSLQADVPGFNHNITLGTGLNATCHTDRRPRYVSLFDGLSTGVWRGRRVVDGEPCDDWDFNSSDGEVSMSACLAKDGVPREYTTTLNPLYSLAQKAFAGRLLYEFGNVSVGPASAGVFDMTDACAHHYPQPLCPDRGVAKLELYRFHSRGEPRSLTNRDVGDALGDMVAYFCGENASSRLHGKVVTRWSVLVNSSFGQYSYCFFVDGQNMCMTESKAVGRESAWGAGSGAIQGQCSGNDDVGSWYTFPGDGECKPGAGVGAGGCTWGEAKALRTVEMSCIFERGLGDACEEEQGSRPLRRPVEILKAAFASSSAASGGCPDAVLPPDADADGGHLVIV